MQQEHCDALKSAGCDDACLATLKDMHAALPAGAWQNIFNILIHAGQNLPAIIAEIQSLIKILNPTPAS